ncbi:MAG: AAA family ATPase [Phycisphaerales bacterium]
MEETIIAIREAIGRVFLGSSSAIDRLLCCVLARGHLLLEDVPGVGKTVLASAAARAIGGEFRRIQMTSDLLPADIIGVSVFDQNTGEFRFVPGPVFANVVIADEINRAPPRTQSALLEAMNENAVSVDGTTHRLDEPFLVIATQNPADYHGAYPLPESQLDRFLIRTAVGYPDEATEVQVLLSDPGAHGAVDVQPAVSLQTVRELQADTERTRLDPQLAQYIRALAHESRRRPELATGLSTRGALALARVARAAARLDGRDYVTTDDIVDHFVEVAAHRLIPRDSGLASDRHHAESIAEELVRAVPMPV